MWEWVRGRKPEVGQSLDPFSTQPNDTEEQWWDRNHLWVTSERDERYELGDRMTIGRGYAPTLPASTLWSSERVFGVAKTRCKDPVSSETVRLVVMGMKDKWGDSWEGTSLSVPSEVHEGNRVPPRPYRALLVSLFKKLIGKLIYKCNKDVSIYFFCNTIFRDS